MDLSSIADALESELGKLIYKDELCPGVLYLAYGGEDGIGHEFLMVDKETPNISATAKAYGAALAGVDGVICFDANDDRSGKDIVYYEARRYCVQHGIPLKENDSLLDNAIWIQDLYPEYFGMIPCPVVTPKGRMTRYITISNGVFGIETETGDRIVAFAYVVWVDSVSEDSLSLRLKTKDNGKYAYAYYSEADSCVPLFELLHEDTGIRRSPYLNIPALMNAVWRHHPDYAIRYNTREQQGLNDLLGYTYAQLGFENSPHGSSDNMVKITEGADEAFIRWA